MKQLIFSFLLIAGLGLTSNLQAQDKLAYVNTAELIQAMQTFRDRHVVEEEMTKTQNGSFQING